MSSDSPKQKTPPVVAHVVCEECGARWSVSCPEGGSPVQPRECENRECDAKWLELPMFMDVADADHAAGEQARGISTIGLFTDA